MRTTTTMFLLLLASVATADEEKTIRWTPPTECVNDVAVGQPGCGELTNYRLRCKNVVTDPLTTLWTVPAPATEDTRTYATGEYWCRLSVSNARGFSAQSNETHFVVANPVTEAVPRPPTNLAAEEPPPVTTGLPPNDPACASRSVVPGACGFGLDWTAVRDWPTEVYRVTSLSKSNTPGTLRHALTSREGWDVGECRDVVFFVGGQIWFDENTLFGTPADRECLRVHGQTAPGDGVVTIGMDLRVNTSHFLLWQMHMCQRELTTQPYNQGVSDVLEINGAIAPVHHAVIVSSSLCFGRDETLNTYKFTSDVSWYQVLVYDPLGNEGTHRFGGIIDERSIRTSVIRSAYVNSDGRNPRVMSSSSLINVITANYLKRGVEFADNPIQANVEGGILIQGPQPIVNVSVWLHALPATANLYVLNGLNGGLNGTDWTDIGYAEGTPTSVTDRDTRILPVWPDGVSVLTFDPDDEEAKREAVRKIARCLGDRQSDRNPRTQDAIDDILSFGETGGAISTVEEAGGYPLAAESQTDHADMPQNPNGPGTPNALMDWAESKNERFLPDDAGCV